MAKQTSTLTIGLGQASLTGKRERNEDFFGCVTPDGDTLRDKGIAVVVADGVGGHLGGLEAAQSSVKSFLMDYYSTPDTWSVEKSIYRVLFATNRWVHAEGRNNPRLQGMATTFSGLVLKGRYYYTAHVGDSRIYRLRDGKLERLTHDHTRIGPNGIGYLTRAIGLEDQLRLETRNGELAVGDTYLFCTDGVWGVLPDATLTTILTQQPDPQRACDTLLEKAVAADSQDNLTAQIIRIEALPDDDEMDPAVRALPALERPVPGMVVDDFELLVQVHKSRMATIFKAKDTRNGETVALKFANPMETDDPLYMDRFLREEWTGRRIRSPYTVAVLPLPPGRRNYLYYAMAFHGGETLAQRLERRDYLSIDEVVENIKGLCQGLSHMHQKGVLHRDIKPDNVLVTRDGQIKIVDMGVVRVEALKRLTPTGSTEKVAPGTPSYMAPELFRGEGGDERSEVYAVGVTLYHLLTRKYPYGEIEPFARPTFSRYTPPSRYNPEVPQWLDWVVEKAVAADPEKRYQLVTALAHQLERPDQVSGEFKPLLERNPELFWKAGFFIMFAVSILFFVLFLLQLG